VYVPQSAQPSEAIPAVHQVLPATVRPAYAGFWLRAVAYLIDTLIMSPVLGLVASLNPSAFMKLPDANTPSFFGMPQPTPLFFVLTFVVVTLYFALFEVSSWQATPGKRILKIYVTDLKGLPTTLARALGRNIAKQISGFVLIGYFLAGFTEKKQALHDILAGCLVLRRP
jgi:uncharacterized RDD family membrane protein YckC